MLSFIIMQGYKIFYKAMTRHYFIYEPISSIWFLFITPGNIRKPYGFLMFSEGIKWKKTGKNGLLKNALQIRYWLLLF